MLLPRAGVVARVELPDGLEVARAQVAAASFLAERGAPVARLFRGETQPLEPEEGGVTLWKRLELLEAEPDLEALGRATHSFHQASRPDLPADLPRLDPFARIASYLRRPSPWSGSNELTELERRHRRLRRDWREIADQDPLGTVVAHGDVNTGNGVLTSRGWVLLDLEDAGVGPASYDFAPLAAEARRYGLAPADYRAFVKGYGHDPAGWEGFELLRETWELLVTTWAVACSAGSPVIEAEARIRVAGLLDGDPRRWTMI